LASEIAYRWTLTPRELYACFVLRRAVPNVVSLPTVPFKGPKRPLEGTPYTYQLGVSDTSKAVSIFPIHDRCPEIPLTGDNRAGVIVFDGALIIGSYVIPGNMTRHWHEIIVRDGYRRQGLATRLVEQWFRETPRVLDISTQHINIMAVGTFLKAHTNLVRWAISNGKDVPEKVRKAVANHEAEEVLYSLRPPKVAPIP